MSIPDINEQLPDLPDTASKYNEQFLEDMDHTLDVLPTWTTRLNNLATQIRSVKDWIASQLPFFQTVIDKANEIQGYVIPTEATYPAAAIDEKIAKAHTQLVLYVDQQDGDDANNGKNPSTAFRTMQRAFNEIPNGGFGEIHISGEYNLGTEAIYTGFKKDIFLMLNNNNRLVTSVNSDGNNSLYGTITIQTGTNFQLYIYSDSNDQIPEGTPKIYIPAAPKELAPPQQAMFSFKTENKGVCSFSMYTRLMVNREAITIDGGYLVARSHWDNDRTYFAHVSIGSHYTGKIRMNNGAKIFNADMMPASYQYSYAGFIYADDNEVPATNTVAGIVKDANGVPRNIVSNIVF